MKKRTEKTILEKAGHQDLSTTAENWISTHKKYMSDKQMFDSLPYISIFYIPVEMTELYQEYETPDMTIDGKDYIKAKMVNVTDTTFEYYYYDNHTPLIVNCEKSVDLFHMKGNIIHKP